MFERTIILILPIIISAVSASNYRVDISSNSPIVKGGTLRLNATVYYEGNIATDGTYKYEWLDNAIPEHSRETDIQNGTDSWNITYDANVYAMGTYNIQVKLKNCVLTVICYEVASARVYIEITETLNGDLLLVQKNETKENDYVGNTSPVIHEIIMKESDRDYIKNAPTVFTYWFIDCTYYGITTDFKFPFNYTTPDEEHFVEALVMADFTPLPPTTTVPPSTTTTKPTSTSTTKPTSTTTTKPTSTITTTSKPTTTLKPNSTTTATATSKPNNTVLISTTIKPDSASNGNTAIKILNKRSVPTNISDVINHAKNVTSRIMVNVKGALVPYNGSFPFICNGTQVTTDSKKSYGYFNKIVNVKAPIAKVNVTGNNWIQHGDLLSLKVNCQGSKNIEYCIEYRRGAYNVTGNETCDRYDPSDSCEFSINHYLSEPIYTIIIVIRNEVNKVVTPVTVTVYEVNTQAQLSVIVVPVAFSLVAVVLIVFGVAYYIQNRSRFIIEVADFNFGQQYSDMEYKTFRERLRDSIMNAFTRGPSPSSSEVPVWPPGRKYGSMT